MIYLIDTIGNETGMHLYDESFADKCRECGEEVSVISNYGESAGIPILHNYYHGNKAVRIAYLVRDWLKLFRFKRHHNGDVFIYQSFGLRMLDMLFFSMFLKSRNAYLLVHDLYEFRASDNGDSMMAMKQRFYRHCPNFICHSPSVRDELGGFRKDSRVRLLYIPHVEYTYPTCYNADNVGEDVKASVDGRRKNILFFGQLSLTKGIDILLEQWNSVSDDFNLIVAGRDKGGILNGYTPPENVKTIIRYIENDELNYLFSVADAVILPYREIYQSGVLETVVHFKKPALLSGIAPFVEYLKEYPSFGEILIDGKLDETLNSLSEKVFYSERDVKHYKDSHSMADFINNLRKPGIAVLCDFVPDEYWTFDRDLYECSGRGCDVYSKPLNHMHGSFVKNRMRSLMYLTAPLKWLRLYGKYDTVIAWQQFFGIGMAFWLRLFRIKKKADIIVMTFIYKPKRGIAGRLYRRFMEFATHGGYISYYVVYSSSEVKQYSDMLGIPEGKIRFTPYFLPEHKIPAPVPDLSEMRYVFSTGRSNRDYDALIEAAEKGGFNLIVACDELPQRDYGPNVRVLSSTYEDEMRKYMYHSEIVAVSLKDKTVSSGQLVFLQAMQFGKVIMCTDCQTVNDYLQDGRNAVLVKSADKWAEEVVRVLGDDALRRRLSAQAHEDFRTKFSRTAFTEAIADLIDWNKA